MAFLHPLADFISCNLAIANLSPSYEYQGRCPQTGQLLKLPRTNLAEAIAFSLMSQLAQHECYTREGKMYGVLLVALPGGEKRVLKAFSGLLNGCSVIAGWIPPIPGRDQVAIEEAQTLAELEAIKQEIITLKQLPARQQYQTLNNDFDQQLKAMSDRHRNSQQQRQEKRQLLCKTMTGENLAIAIEELNEESRRDGIERRQLKRCQNEVRLLV